MGVPNLQNNFPFTFNFDIDISGTSGTKPPITIPTGSQNSVNYALLDNRGNDATLNVFLLNSDVVHGAPRYVINPNEARTIYLTGLLNQGFVVTYTAGVAAAGRSVKIYLGDQDFGINTQSQGTVSVTVVGGPAATQLPAALTANGDLKTAILESIPLPIEPCNFVQKSVTAANTALSVVQNAAAGKTCYIEGFSVSVGGAAIGLNDLVIQLLDGATVIYTEVIGALAARGARVSMDFSKPIPCTLSASCSLITTAGGGASTILYGNIYGVQK